MQIYIGTNDLFALAKLRYGSQDQEKEIVYRL